MDWGLNLATCRCKNTKDLDVPLDTNKPIISDINLLLSVLVHAMSKANTDSAEWRDKGDYWQIQLLDDGPYANFSKMLSIDLPDSNDIPVGNTFINVKIQCLNNTVSFIHQYHYPD